MRVFGWQDPPTDEVMTRSAPVLSPQPDPAYEAAVQKTAETIGRLRRMGYELPAVSQQVQRGGYHEHASE